MTIDPIRAQRDIGTGDRTNGALNREIWWPLFAIGTRYDTEAINPPLNALRSHNGIRARSCPTFHERS